MEHCDLEQVNNELQELVSRDALQHVASFGLRGELFYALPHVVQYDPHLVGYYRLLLGLSQKEFYNKGPFGRFKRLEERGEIRPHIQDQIVPLCRSLIRSAEFLVLEIDSLSTDVIHDLQLLTLGPQLRGGENTRLGQVATQEVYDLIQQLVSQNLKGRTKRTITIENDSGRTVQIEFFSDPDVRITEVMETGIRPLVSIEIKGGKDASNIHNRIGEAEKSHQKARGRGFFEFWTVIRVDVDTNMAKKESPTTTHFFHLDRVCNHETKDHRLFRDLLASITGIRL